MYNKKPVQTVNHRINVFLCTVYDQLYEDPLKTRCLLKLPVLDTVDQGNVTRVSAYKHASK